MQARVTSHIEYMRSQTTLELKISVFNGDFNHEFHVSQPCNTSYSEWMGFFSNRESIGLYTGSGGCTSHMSWVGNRIRIVSELSGTDDNNTTQTDEFNSEPLVNVLRRAIEDLHKSKLI